METKYEQIKTDSEKEITRLNYIISDYRKKIKTIDNNENIDTSTQVKKEDSEIELKNLISERENLKIEKEKFAEKNKKLWQQSIAIHKEKERIDKLKKEVEKKHKEVTDSIKYAQKIQTALLPSQTSFDESIPNHFIFWRPRDIVSGDFYWTNRIDNKFVVVAADCTGHGVPGAFMSMLGISFLNEIVITSEIKAAEILERMRSLVKESLSQTKKSETKDGMDLALCIIDFDNNTLEFAGANNPLFMVRNNELEVTKPTRNPIGIYAKERPFKSTTIELQKGDKFYIFSDGFQDQFGGPQDRKFGTRNMKQLVIDLNVNNIPINKQAEHFEEAYEDWKNTISESGKKQKQVDDIILIGFEY